MEIDVETLVRETQIHSPQEGVIITPFLEESRRSASFSKDILPIEGEVRVFCHLSIGQQRYSDDSDEEVLDQFKAVLGEPFMTCVTYPTWKIGREFHPGEVHHFFWKSEEKIPATN